jgi:PadR family transcriptional regulator PadR
MLKLRKEKFMDKNLVGGSTTMLILSLLNEKEMYGYQLLTTLSKRSDNTFSLKSGTLYPILHSLEERGLVTAREAKEETRRVHRYYKITGSGQKELQKKKTEWNMFASVVKQIMQGGFEFEQVR